MAISDKLTYLNTTKTLIREGLNNLGASLTSNDTFRSYVNVLNDLYDYLPKVTGSGANVTLNDTKKGLMKITLDPSELSQSSTPSPSSPQDIHTISGSNTIKVEGKNLYVGSQDFSGTWNNSASWTTADETYNGLVVKKRDGQWNGLSKNIQVESGKTYTYSLYVKSDSTRPFAIYTSGGTATCSPADKNFTSTTSWQRYSLTFVANSTGTLRLRVENTSSNVGNYTYICGYQLEESPSMTSYEPYISQEADIDLGDLEYCKIGTYADEFIRSNDGTWQLKKNIGKVVLDGTEAWGTNASWNYTNTNLYILSNTFLTTSNEVKTSHFKWYQNAYSNDIDGEVGIVWGSSLSFRIDNTLASDVANFKTWLSSNNVSLYYILSTPTYTQITGTLETQLENVYQKLLSYDNQTNISQINNDLAFIINSSALQDLS